MTTNFLFFLNTYGDIVPTTVPALNNFKWSREINGVPYNLENSQQIQIPISGSTSNIIPYPFSTPTNSGSYVVNGTTTMVINSSVAGIAVGNLVVGTPIPAGTTVTAIGTTQYTFTVTSAHATVGAVYSNNGQTFTVGSTIVAGTTLVATGAADPTASGTLTLVSGTGDATIAFSSFTETTSITMSQAATSSGTVAISFYAPAAFVYMESDQQVSVIYNNGSPMALNPFQVNGRTVPGVFFMNGPVYSITVTNPSAAVANVFFALMG